jgi:hypothetical protein
VDIDPTKKRKLSDHALELIMRDVLQGMRGPTREMQTDASAAMTGTDDHGLSSGSAEGILGSTKK